MSKILFYCSAIELKNQEIIKSLKEEQQRLCSDELEGAEVREKLSQIRHENGITEYSCSVGGRTTKETDYEINSFIKLL
jgi:hypothetical protein